MEERREKVARLYSRKSTARAYKAKAVPVGEAIIRIK